MKLQAWGAAIELSLQLIMSPLDVGLESGSFVDLGMVDVVEVEVLHHACRHVRCPLENLGLDVDEEGVRGPSSQDHYFKDGLVGEEQGHCCSGANGMGADLVWGVSVRGLATV